jgi:glycosyltransferase involved in cell wall biosynthesis
MSEEHVAGMVSILVPTFNSAAYLAETLESALTQDFRNIELVVVDDGSEDRSVAVAESFGDRVRVLARPHQGVAATRNACIAQARGAFVMFLDADDLMPRESLARRMQEFAADPTLDIVTGMMECFHSPDLGEAVRQRYRLPDGPQQGHMPGTAVIRTSAFDRYGAIDETVPVMCELEWMVRAQDMGARIRLIDEIVLRRRIHGGNMSLTRKAQIAADQLMIVRASLARRRAAAASVRSAEP